MNAPEPPEPRAMRASDADRDLVADRLREALAEGRITAEEHAERLDTVYAAKTYTDLEPVLADLPGGSVGPADRPAAEPERVNLTKEPDPAPPRPQSGSIVAVFAGASRRGRWLVEPTTTVTCLFGGAELDFRRAVLSQSEVTVNVTCIFGGVDVTVPPGVRLVNSISAVMGGVDLPDDDTDDPDAPIIRLTGLALFGGVSVSRSGDGSDRRRHMRDLHGRMHQEIMDRHREERLRRRDARQDHLRRLRESRRRD